MVQDYQKEASSVAQQLEVGDISTDDVETVVHRLIAELEQEEESQRKRDMLQRQLG
jgi:DNA-binding ferritin-like protein (Dps family)